ncbi:MAG: hypothetical protein JWO38_823 [Gemmataceae bacterium]|nr:hypothetical protein [Gemmataceae bacterium]
MPHIMPEFNRVSHTILVSPASHPHTPDQPVSLARVVADLVAERAALIDELVLIRDERDAAIEDYYELRLTIDPVAGVPL